MKNNKTKVFKSKISWSISPNLSHSVHVLSDLTWNAPTYLVSRGDFWDLWMCLHGCAHCELVQCGWNSLVAVVSCERFFTCLSTHVHAHSNTCIHTHTNTCIHTHTHTHTHTRLHDLSQLITLCPNKPKNEVFGKYYAPPPRKLGKEHV